MVGSAAWQGIAVASVVFRGFVMHGSNDQDVDIIDANRICAGYTTDTVFCSLPHENEINNAET
jgi:hypothetical protein